MNKTNGAQFIESGEEMPDSRFRTLSGKYAGELNVAKWLPRLAFIQEGLFRAEISNASGVTLFLLPTVNLELRPKLLSDLKPGTRIISHRFHLGDWKPRRVAEVSGHKIYYWVVPDVWGCA